MASRIILQVNLEAILGSRNVYFQPPETLRMKYPCIVYKRDTADIKHADDMAYNYQFPYEVTVIYEDADSMLPEAMIKAFPMIRHNRHFAVDNLYHDVFTIYY